MPEGLRPLAQSRRLREAVSWLALVFSEFGGHSSGLITRLRERGFPPASKQCGCSDAAEGLICGASTQLAGYWISAEPWLVDFTGAEPGSWAMDFVLQEVESLRSWQTVCDLAISPPSWAIAMALPLRLLLPWTAERVFTLSPPAEAPMPIACELDVGLLEVAPTPRVEALWPFTAALPALPPVALPVGVLSRAKAGADSIKASSKGRGAFILCSCLCRDHSRNIRCVNRASRRRPP